MKKILVMVVIGAAAMAAAQNTTQPAPSQPPAAGTQSQPAAGASPAAGAQSQPSSAGTQAPVIKDPAEYNAYVNAIQQKDPTAQISGLEAFLTQYPNSVMKTAALQTLMQDYQQTNNQAKTLDAANKLVAADSCNVRALALLAYLDRISAQSGGANPAQLLADAQKNGQQGMDCLPKFNKPEGTSDDDFKKMKDQMSNIFQAAIGVAALQNKEYPKAVENLKPVADANPQDFSVVYPLALAYWPDPKTPANPPENALNAIWYAVRASAAAPPQAQAQVEKYARSLYVRYHGGDDGWPDVLAKAKAGTAAPPDIATLIKPAPSPADQARNMLAATAPEKMDFAQWEFILSNGDQTAQDTVWNAIKGKPVQMNGQVIKSSATEFDIAGSSDDIDAKKPDITLNFEEKVPLKMIPKEGASLDFQGEPASYTPNPFMMVMNNGKLLKAAAPTPAKKPAATTHHKPASQ